MVLRGQQNGERDAVPEVVAVHHALAVRVGERAGHVAEHAQRLIERQPTSAR